MDDKEFDAMCRKAGIKKEMLCDTVFTRQFKEENKMDDWGIDELINKGGVMILTPEQEDLICEANQEKKLEEEIAKKIKKCKVIPINPERFDQILKGIGRRKLGKTTIKVKRGL